MEGHNLFISHPPNKEGFDRLTSHMAKHPELAIFRRFSILNDRMLLYLQAELTLQEGRLLLAINSDQSFEDAERRQFSCNSRLCSILRATLREPGHKERSWRRSALSSKPAACSTAPFLLNVTGSADSICVQSRCVPSTKSRTQWFARSTPIQSQKSPPRATGWPWWPFLPLRP